MPLWITVLATGVAGILSGLGVGSAGLFVLYLTFALGMEQVAAQGLNLQFFLFSAGASLLFHVKKRRIPRDMVIFLVLCALPGAVAGTHLLTLLNRALIKRLFGVMLTVSGCLAFFRKAQESQPS